MPAIAGRAARLFVSSAGLRGRLESTAEDKGVTGYDQTFGNGRLNSYKAVTSTALGD
jgi:hypothetical protein